MEEKEKKIKEIDNEINIKKNQGETKEIKGLKKSLEDTKNQISGLKISINRRNRFNNNKIEELKKSLEISKKKYEDLDKEIKSQSNYDKEIKELEKILKRKGIKALI